MGQVVTKELKPYQLWYYSDGGYQLRQFDTLKELMFDLSNIYTSDYWITKKCDIEIKELI